MSEQTPDNLPVSDGAASADTDEPSPPKGGGRSHLKLVK